MGKAKKGVKRFQGKLRKGAPLRKGPKVHKKNNPTSVDTQSAQIEDKKDLENVSVDEFMDEAFFSAIDGDNDSDDDGLQEAAHESEEDEEKDEIHSHKQTLESLKETDPEFYEYLKKNDQELLQFGEDEELDGDEEAEEEEGEGKEDENAESLAGEAEKGPEKTRITMSVLKTWAGAAAKGSFRATRQLVVAFRTAAHCNDEDADSEAYAFVIDNSSVFNQLVLFCLRNMHKIFNKLLDYHPDNGSNVLPSSSLRWKRMFLVVKGYLSNLLYFMQQMTDPKMVGFILRSTEHLIPYIAAVPNYPTKFLKCFLTMWGEAAELVRILAFLNIHKLALRIPYPFINQCLKGIYLTYVRNSKFTHANNYSTIDFMANCVVELYSLDPSAAYMHAFVYIRQLALHLRNALMMKSKDAHINVYNWQFVNSLRVWARLISGGTAGHPPAELRPLIYPLVQLIFGVISLVPTPRYYPLRFICVRLLLRIAESTRTFVNVLPYLLQVLEGQDFKKAPRASTVKPIVFQYTLKAGPSLLNTAVYTKGVYSQVMDLLVYALAVYSHAVAFPELVVPALVSLKKFQKNSKNVSFSKEMQQLIEKIETNVAFVRSHRASIGFTAGWAAKASEGETRVAVDKKTPLELFRAHKEQLASALKRAAEEAEGDSDEDGMDEDDEEEEGGEEIANPSRPPTKRRKVTAKEAKEQKAAQAAKNRAARQKASADGEDIVEDLDVDAFSGDEDEEEGSD